MSFTRLIYLLLVFVVAWCGYYLLTPKGNDAIQVAPDTELPLFSGTGLENITYGEDGDIHGFRTMVLKDDQGEPAPVHTVASGLDYPGVGPEHAHLYRTGKANYTACDDKEALNAFYALSRHEGIIPALESAHAVAFAMREAADNPGKSILINLSGRGDKDIDYVTETFGFGGEE